MKNIIIAIVMAVTTISISAYTKPPKKATITFHVSGTCDMCKERIENALDVKGVKSADYNVESEEVTVVYNPRKLEVRQLHNLVAIAGHDTDEVKASEQAYADLPECCLYRDGAKCTDH